MGTWIKAPKTTPVCRRGPRGAPGPCHHKGKRHPGGPFHAPDDFLCLTASVGDPASAQFGRSWPSGRGVGPDRGVLEGRGRSVGFGAFPGLLHRLLVGAAADGLGRPFARLRGVHRAGGNRASGAYAVDRPLCLGGDAGGHGPVHRRLLHGDRGLAERQDHQRNPGPGDGRISHRRHGRVPVRAAADRRVGACALRLLQPAGHVVLRGDPAACHDPKCPAGDPRRTASETGAGLVDVTAGGGRG